MRNLWIFLNSVPQLNANQDHLSFDSAESLIYIDKHWNSNLEFSSMYIILIHIHKYIYNAFLPLKGFEYFVTSTSTHTGEEACHASCSLLHYAPYLFPAKCTWATAFKILLNCLHPFVWDLNLSLFSVNREC